MLSPLSFCIWALHALVPCFIYLILSDTHFNPLNHGPPIPLALESIRFCLTLPPAAQWPPYFSRQPDWFSWQKRATLADKRRFWWSHCGSRGPSPWEDGNFQSLPFPPHVEVSLMWRHKCGPIGPPVIFPSAEVGHGRQWCNVPPGYIGWRGGMTTLCQSRLYPTVSDKEFGYWTLPYSMYKCWRPPYFCYIVSHLLIIEGNPYSKPTST